MSQCAKGHYNTLEEVMAGAEQNIFADATVEVSGDETYITASIPATNINADGSLDFCIAIIYYVNLTALNISSVDCSITSETSNLFCVQQTINYEFRVSNYSLINETMNVGSQIVEDTYTIDENESLYGVYSYKNYVIKNIPEDNNGSLEFEIVSETALGAVVLNGIHETVSIYELFLAMEAGGNVVEFINGKACFALDLNFDDSNEMKICIAVYYGNDSSAVGQNVNISLKSEHAGYLIYTLNSDSDGAYYSVSGIRKPENHPIITIPAYYHDIPVKVIEDRVFQDNQTVQHLRFEENSNLTTIGEYSFRRCDNLISIQIPKSITRLGSETFDECENLTDIYVEDLVAYLNITGFWSRTFYNPDNLYVDGELVTDLVIPKEIKFNFSGSKQISNYIKTDMPKIKEYIKNLNYDCQYYFGVIYENDCEDGFDENEYY